MGARERVSAQVRGRAALHRAGGEAPPLRARRGGVLVRRGGPRRAGLDHRLRVVLLAAVDGDPGPGRARHAARGVLVLQRPAKTDIKQLMEDALILARSKDFDVFNALDLMENARFLKDLKFGIGDGNLRYYLYNWRLNDVVEPSQIALVLT